MISCLLSRLTAGGMLKAIIPAVFATVFFSVHAESQHKGCAMSAQQFAQVQPSPVLYPRTGNHALDQAFQRELQLLVETFQIQPRFAFLDDSDGPNAFAHPNGIVMFGINMIKKLLNESISGEGFGISAVMAHEFAHIVQFRTNTYDQPIKFPELHADYMAGWYLAKRQQYLPTDIRDGFHSVFKVGDYNLWSPQHHGTPQERLAAAIVGAGDHRLDLGTALDVGRNFVGMVYKQGYTPLFWAATLNNFNAVKLLLEARSLLGNWANPNVPFDTRTKLRLLHILTTTKEKNEITRQQEQRFGMQAVPVDIQIVRMLLAAEANPNVTTINGMTPLTMAVMRSDIQFVEALLANRANPDVTFEAPDGSRATPLHIAVYLGDVAVVEALLNAGADPTIEANGVTPFKLAAQQFANPNSSKEMSNRYFAIMKLFR